jgi:hypothetical protein
MTDTSTLMEVFSKVNSATWRLVLSLKLRAYNLVPLSRMDQRK